MREVEKVVKSPPIAFLDERGRIVIVGFEAWNNASFVDADRAFPGSWQEIIVATKETTNV